MTHPHDRLLAAVKARGNGGDPWGYGIVTADRHVKTVEQCVGHDLCYRYAATRQKSWDDLVRKAAKTLVYSNPDSVLDTIEWEKRAGSKSQPFSLGDIELPKNTLMVFKHVLTTPRKDRDGDVLRTRGAKPDPSMLLLWQHIHTLPIGKMLVVAEHNEKVLRLVSCIVDMNALCHDAAVMVDNKMGRFSHGFRALDFSEMKAEDGETTSPGGFDVKDFEIMEESLVSVPSNVDAETEEIVLSLVEGGKLTSPLMKNYGRGLREKRAVRVPVTLDLRVLVDGAEIQGDANATATKNLGGAKAGPACGCHGKPASEKTNGKPAGHKEDGSDEPQGVMCPRCGEGCNPAGMCEKCGYRKDTGPLMRSLGMCEKCGTPMVKGEDGLHCEKCGMKAAETGNGGPESGVCPKCGKPMKDGMCECGYGAAEAGGPHWRDQPRYAPGQPEGGQFAGGSVRGYNPQQPRHPAGTSQGGQWSGGGGGAAGDPLSLDNSAAMSALSELMESGDVLDFIDENWQDNPKIPNVLSAVENAIRNNKVGSLPKSEMHLAVMSAYADYFDDNQDFIYQALEESKDPEAAASAYGDLINALQGGPTKSTRRRIKSGRTLSRKTLNVLREILEDLTDLSTKGYGMERGGAAICERAAGKLHTLLSQYAEPQPEEEKSAKAAAALFLALADEGDLNTMRQSLATLKEVAERHKAAEQFRAMVGAR